MKSWNQKKYFTYDKVLIVYKFAVENTNKHVSIMVQLRSIIDLKYTKQTNIRIIDRISISEVPLDVANSLIKNY